MQVAHLGGITFVHCGTPCNTFSAARKLDGGPPPLRSPQEPMGLPSLSADNATLVLLGNFFLYRSVEVCTIVYTQGGDFSIENPLLSLWVTPSVQVLSQACRTIEVDFDQCAFGAPSMKPTRLLVTSEAFLPLHKKCPRDHLHVVLKGKSWNTKLNRWVFKTKQAQVYPVQMCSSMAMAVRSCMLQDLSHFQPSFDLVLSAAERTRATRSRLIGKPLRHAWRSPPVIR